MLQNFKKYSLGRWLTWNRKQGCGFLLTISLFILGMSLITVGRARNLVWEDIRDRLGYKVNRLFPVLGEQTQDEAFYAQSQGNLSQKALQSLLDGSSEDYFEEADYGITLNKKLPNLAKTLDPYIPGITETQAKQRVARGRNHWLLWTGGNDRFWSYMTRATLGALDFLKTLSDYPHSQLKVTSRSQRWETLGLVNEPCFKQTNQPRMDRWGLYFPERDLKDPSCGENGRLEPFEDEQNYPGIEIGARIKGQSRTWTFQGQSRTDKFDVGSYYGYASGVVGLRLFPNPDFDQEAASQWDSERFYSDPAYYNNPNLIRPYRVGMTCAFCHVGPNPSNPPQDFNAPLWANLNSNPGAQYYWVDRIFNWNWVKDQSTGKSNFMYQLLHTSRPGALDTSLVSSDMINNPRSMNAVYDLGARVKAVVNFNQIERLVDPETMNIQFNFFGSGEIPSGSPLLGLSDYPKGEKQGFAFSPRVLKDGSDSVGTLGALNRVPVNIGLFSEEWIQNFIPLLGGPAITPFRISHAQERSHYWRATENQTADVTLFFIAASRPDYLAIAPEGPKFIKVSKLQKGKEIFAQNCAGCHSSKLPEKAFSFFKPVEDPSRCVGKGYLDCWKEYWKYINSSEFKHEMLKLVQNEEAAIGSDSFKKGNYFSTELRVPNNIVDSQLCSPIATNALQGDIWDNFSSQSYKELPSIGEFRVNFPTRDGGMSSRIIPKVPGGGRGYQRPPSLISVWSTAPFLQNNTLGKFERSGTVKDRLESFENSIQLLLFPEKRGEVNYASKGKRIVEYHTGFGDRLKGTLDETIEPSYIKIPRGYLPDSIFYFLKKIIEEELGERLNQLKTDFIDLDRFNSLSTRSFYDKDREKERNDSFGFNKVIDFTLGLWREKVGPNKAHKEDDDENAMLVLGPIPQGVPINLLSNIDMGYLINPKLLLDMTAAVRALIRGLLAIRDLESEQMKTKVFLENVTEPLLKVSKCEDFVVDRGHYFGTKYGPDRKGVGFAPGPDGLPFELTVTEKEALIEYIKSL